MPDLLTIDAARERVLETVQPLPAEPVPLAEARGRIVAAPVRAAADVPPFASSAMDGFAVPPGADGTLRIVGESRAGHPYTDRIEKGTAVRISTGAVVPQGTGAVVMVERTEERDGTVTVPAAPPGDNVRGAGEDIAAGTEVLATGAELGPAALGVLASIGQTTVGCARRPRVGLLATGDELAPTGSELGPGQIYSSNSPTLAAMVEAAGGQAVLGRDIPDTEEGTREGLAQAIAESDVVCVTGGVSVGPHDHVKGAFAELGIEERFWRVALKPGKPTWFGTGERDGRRVWCFGLPGNPVSAVVTFILFVRPALRALQGAPPEGRRIRAELTQPVPRLAGRTQALRCAVQPGPGGWRLTPTGPQGSHQLTSMLGAGALAFVPAGEGEIRPGETVDAELVD